ncbi:hypothetical protein OK351_05720 [Glutamicibacter sp. MNS18]|uniref:hypothetical protein n=1 Tax=Glutamicibacter sp. MNS18 TaxID=2989817 RepID=UPI0022366AE9|nr:hypothetical protein [Glutamicibacter sp. MNS18]MCW4465000.1 hypothetical protein [Glutamicibacter sp. MNS18]
MRLPRRALAGSALLLICACSAEPAPCTEIGVPSGIGLEIPAAQAREVAGAGLRVCWDSTCQDTEPDLVPSTRAGDETCAGTMPGDSCSVRMVPTGALHGFADLPGLPEAPVQVRVSLHDATGATLFDREISVVPQRVHPNGPHCPGDGLQTTVIAEGNQLQLPAR